ncbi:E3 ubiquitin-protein ligase MARCHF4-like [Gadus chalcogrammus]|uniref:E3 ubiquitin-protein ligase MARCHF4-like n=1 Tax=Gadus chalcogrammus TaxID=1042646 RepID=UPI0024C4DC11|nr:E3 ubiquitin-protein ligase MARCHF4-like [Gadus chalcogrammus]
MQEEEKGSREEKFHDDMSINSLNDSGARTPLCRICFQGPEQGEMLSPCRCSGSVRCSHEPCLVKWISERGSWSCEICYYKYHVVSISTKNPLQWRSITLTVIERVQMAAALLGSLFLLASVSWLVWSSLSPNARWQRRDLLFQICYAMYGFMDLVCIVLIIHEGPSVFRIFHRWQAVNQRWKVLNYDKARDLAEQQKPDAPPRRQPPLPAPSGRAGAPPSPSPPRHRQTGTAPSSRSSALLAAVAMTMTPAHPGVTSSPDPEEEEEERGGPAMEESEVTPTTAGGRGAPGPQARSPSPTPPTPQTQGTRDPNRELVMRVTSL